MEKSLVFPKAPTSTCMHPPVYTVTVMSKVAMIVHKEGYRVFRSSNSLRRLWIHDRGLLQGATFVQNKFCATLISSHSSHEPKVVAHINRPATWRGCEAGSLSLPAAIKSSAGLSDNFLSCRDSPVRSTCNPMKCLRVIRAHGEYPSHVQPIPTVSWQAVLLLV